MSSDEQVPRDGVLGTDRPTDEDDEDEREYEDDYSYHDYCDDCGHEIHWPDSGHGIRFRWCAGCCPEHPEDGCDECGRDPNEFKGKIKDAVRRAENAP